MPIPMTMTVTVTMPVPMTMTVTVSMPVPHAPELCIAPNDWDV